MANDELNWVMGVVGPTNIAVSCRLDDTAALYRWVDGLEHLDSRSSMVIGTLFTCFHDLLASGFDKEDISMFYSSINDDFEGVSPAVFMREHDLDAFLKCFYTYFSREKMDRAAGEVFARSQNYGLTVSEIKSVLDAGSMRELLELASLGSAVYTKDGVERLLREPYTGLSEVSPVELLQTGVRNDLFCVHKIIERLREHV